ncbi:MAG: phage terminase large subunit, partial [Bacteroidetes bacterium]|nr:phage terminase large subunit [Bacteroidota bacterium]
SVTVGDFISWVAGLNSNLKIIYAAFSQGLTNRCNLHVQRIMTLEKYKKIFPDITLPQKSHKAIRTTSFVEYLDKDNQPSGGSLRNTTTGGAVTGETTDLGIIDDPLKGREAANSEVIRDKAWDWLTNDFLTRFSEFAGLLITGTRWHIDDPIQRSIDNIPNAKVFNFPALAVDNEEHRKVDEPLFPELKSEEFLLTRKKVMLPAYWEALYQGSPTIVGGNMIKDEWWQWWEMLPKLKYKFIVADTAQKAENQHDWAVFQCWGVGIDDNIYMLDKLRAKLEAPELRREAEIFYKKHDNKRPVYKNNRTTKNEERVMKSILRCMYIEDKSSGIGLIQELRKKKVRVKGIPRNIDKVLRGQDASPYIENGQVYLNADIPDIDNTTKEGREFPDGVFDDDIDTLFSAIEVGFINNEKHTYYT